MNNKKIVGVLTALLIVTLALPVFADNHMEDKVKITGEVKSVFQVGGYGDNENAAIALLEDDDALDEDSFDDPDLFPADKAFYQEIDFSVAGMVNDNISFDLAIDTLANNFTTVEGPSYQGVTLGDQGDANDLVMDNALLTIADDVSTLKIGDINGFHGDVYFVDDEDLEGMEMTTAMSGNDVRVFMGGNSNYNGSEYDGDFENTDFYGVTVGRELDVATVTGKVYQRRKDGESVTDLAVAADADLTDMVAVNGEIVSSDDSDADSDTLMMLGTDVKVSDTVNVNAKMEMAGEDFTSVAGDLEEDSDYDLYTVGGEMKLNTNNTMGASYTMVTPGETLDGDEEDKSTIELTLDNTMGAYTNNASIAMTTNDGYVDGQDVTVIKLGTEYAMDAATLNAELTNQSSDDFDNDFTYLTVGLDQQISENVTWNTSLGYITGTANAEIDYTDTNGDVQTYATLDDEDGDATTLETSLTVKF